MPKENKKLLMHQFASPKIFKFAAQLRKEMTEAERVLWQALRNKKLKGAKFRRQHPIGNFILDFYCNPSQLAIEVDGGYHNSKEQKFIDEERDKALSEIGIKVLRFRNEEVFNDLEGVLKRIAECL